MTLALPLTLQLFAAIGGSLPAAPALAEAWRVSASASATETYTSNVDYASRSLAEGDFATSVTGSLNFSGEGARLKLNGSIAGTGTFYADHSENNSFAPQVSLLGHLEAIEKFAFIDARASVTQTFASPFGAQPGNLVNATQNRYTQQAYEVSPYIQGVFGSSGVSYRVRDDSVWTVASSFGNSSTSVPNTYSNNLDASINSPTRQWGWSVTYNRFYYDNGISNVADIGYGATKTQIARLIVPYQIDPQLQIAPRIGYQKEEFPLQSNQGVVYGIGGQWNPTDRTNINGYWEHQFFGAAYSAQLSHRLPNAAISANFSRGLSSYPQQALAIPAGATVTQFLDAAFATRIPDPAERAIAIEQFLSRTGLPPTLASPVNIYSTTLTLQQSATVSLVLVGALNSITFSIFYLKNDVIGASGNELPPAFQFGQNTTQTGAGVGYAYRLTAFTNLSANATYSTTTSNTDTGPLAGARTDNANVSLALNTRFTPKTTGAAGVTLSQTRFPSGTDFGTSSALNIFATITHIF